MRVTLEDHLADTGRFARIETRGRVSGRPLAVMVGFVEEPEGSLLVAAGEPETDWARNLEIEPRCQVTVAGRTWTAVAEPLKGPDRARAVAELILRYGTPAERLGRGAVLRLRPVAPEA